MRIPPTVALVLALAASFPLMSPASRADGGHAPGSPARTAAAGDAPLAGVTCALLPVTLAVPRELTLPPELLLEIPASDGRIIPLRARVSPAPAGVAPPPPPSVPGRPSLARVREIKAGQSAYYVVDIRGSSDLPAMQLRGSEVASGVYQGSAQVGQNVSMRGTLITGGGTFVAHDTDVAVVRYHVLPNLEVAGGLHSSVRAGDGNGLPMFAAGGGPGATLSYRGDQGDILHMQLSGVPALSAAARGAVPTAVFTLGVSYDWK